ncbi:MAG: hypothetical protein PHF64_01680 [Methanoregula sp.]|nr:hypothetical protein [Methanoregula sp.]
MGKIRFNVMVKVLDSSIRIAGKREQFRAQPLRTRYSPGIRYRDKI